MRGQVILRVIHKGELVSMITSISLEDIEERPLLTRWLFKEMDFRLYDRIGCIPRDREWEVVVRG